MNHQIGACKYCAQPIYKNLERGASVKVWVHKETGAMYCDTTATHKATP